MQVLGSARIKAVRAATQGQSRAHARGKRIALGSGAFPVAEKPVRGRESVRETLLGPAVGSETCSECRGMSVLKPSRSLTLTCKVSGDPIPSYARFIWIRNISEKSTNGSETTNFLGSCTLLFLLNLQGEIRQNVCS